MPELKLTKARVDKAAHAGTSNQNGPSLVVIRLRTGVRVGRSLPVSR